MRNRNWVLLVLLSWSLMGCDADDAGEAATDWQADSTPAHWWMSVVHTDTQRLVVGGSPEAGVILRDGGDGNLAPVDIGEEVGLLNWVHAFPDGTLVTVGYEGAMFTSDDGVNWERIALDTDQRMWGVWGASKDDVWAVGGKGQVEGDAVIFRGPLGAMEPIEIEIERPNVNAWFKVWGSSGDDVYIVGQKGALLHWDGTELKETGVGLTEDLIGVWGTGPDQVAVVGGRNNGVMALWDGNEWRGMELAPVTGLNGVWLRGNTVHAVGVDEAKVLRVDFASGDLLEEEDFLGTRIPEAEGIELHAVHGSADGKLSAVGGNYALQSGPFEGVVVSRQLGGGE